MAKPLARRVITWQLSGEQPRDLRLSWQIGHAACAALEDELFGQHVLITDHDDWPIIGTGGRRTTSCLRKDTGDRLIQETRARDQWPYPPAGSRHCLAGRR
jgi:hypothetical protein